jgi:hypothetical protein
MPRPILIVALLAIAGCSPQPVPRADRQYIGVWAWPREGPPEVQITLRPDATASFDPSSDRPVPPFQGAWHRDDDLIIITENPSPLGEPPPPQHVLRLKPLGAMLVLKIEGQPYLLERR